MKSSIDKILKYRKAYYSQHGEDGILEYMLEKLPEKTGWCAEFGAWDGKTYSNTYHFISLYNFNGVMIEGNDNLFPVLQNNMSSYSNCILINKMVSISGDNCLDNILKETKIPVNFDLLSIDIDGDDYHVWKSLNDYLPSIVVIEINWLDKPEVIRVTHPDTPKIVIKDDTYEGLWGEGASLLSMTILAEEKGYNLVAHIGTNAIFVQKQYLKLFHEDKVSVNDVFSYEGFELYDFFKELQKNKR
ncbi:MAG: hypothetical protein HQK78_05565 [Desulfobacterales bacterium]|nr:hypothetical protein [Desulfobacterales bacterium]